MARQVKPKYVLGPDVDLDREKMARDALRQVRGRPSLTGKAIESPQLKLRIPMKLKKAIEKEAKRRGETTSTVVREVLQERFLQKG
jgi:predicted HicB family RNase H-like nuclease